MYRKIKRKEFEAYNKMQKGEKDLDLVLGREYNHTLTLIQDALDVLNSGTNDLSVVHAYKEYISARLDSLIGLACYLPAERCNEWSSMLDRYQKAIDACFDAYCDYTVDFGKEEKAK
jgi:hypothetical protein